MDNFLHHCPSLITVKSTFKMVHNSNLRDPHSEKKIFWLWIISSVPSIVTVKYKFKCVKGCQF